MAMANFIIKMVVFMRVNGDITKWMDQVNYIINQTNQRIRDNGKMINFMGME